MSYGQHFGYTEPSKPSLRMHMPVYDPLISGIHIKRQSLSKGCQADGLLGSPTWEVRGSYNWLHNCSYNPLISPLSRVSWVMIGL